MDAERLHRQPASGVVEERLVEEEQVVQARDEVVAGGAHLAHHLGVPALVGLEERPAAELVADRHAEEKRPGGEEERLPP